MRSAPLVNCPQCGKSSIYSSKNRFRPFCSERCKMIDLGAWANESYRVPVAETPELTDSDASNDQQ
jgi:uncharacterized protein